MDDGQKVQGSIQCEPIVKIEPPEDIKDQIHNDFFNTNLLSSTSLWSYLLKTARYKYQKEHGKKMDYVKMTKILVIEVEHFMDEVSNFVRSCCNSQVPPSDQTTVNTTDINENIINISTRLSQVVLLPNSVTQVELITCFHEFRNYEFTIYFSQNFLWFVFLKGRSFLLRSNMRIY